MNRTIRDIMTTDVQTVSHTAALTQAARIMRDADIGDVVVTTDDNRPCGIITDRDIVVRSLAAGNDPATATVGTVCSQHLVTVEPDDEIDLAVRLMRDESIRRLPVCDSDGNLQGVVTLGDLAVERDPDSALARISANPPKN